MANKKKSRKEKHALIKQQLDRASVAVAEEEYAEDSAVDTDAKDITTAELVAQLEGFGEISDNDSDDAEREQKGFLEARKASLSTGKKRRKYSMEELKRVLQQRLGISGVELWESVDMHTGNAPHPVFLSQLQSVRRSVPVPFHWTQLSVFLSKQLDRPESNVVPEAVEDTNVRQIRKNKISSVNVASFAQCFVTANPLVLKGFSADLTVHGQVFYSNMWRAPRKHQPGTLSRNLRQALGMDQTSALPWLHEMQAVEELPPSRATMTVPGMNAPIPPGGSWGRADGQWGNPPRDAAGNYLYPSIRGDVKVKCPRPFGALPPRRHSMAAAPEVVAPTLEAAAPAPSDSQSRITIRPSPFAPKTTSTFTGTASAVVQSEEYYRTMVGEDDLLEVGERLRSKAGAVRSRHTAERQRHDLEADLLRYE